MGTCLGTGTLEVNRVLFAFAGLPSPRTDKGLIWDNIIKQWNPSSLDDMVRFMVRSTLCGRQTKKTSAVSREAIDWLVS